MGLQVADHPMLVALPEPGRSEVAASVRQTSYPAGRVILEEGTLSTDFFLILGGEVEVSRRDQVSATLMTGSFFGEMSAMDAGPGYAMARNATVRAQSDVELGVIGEDDFRRFSETMPGFREAVHQTLESRR